MSRRFKHSMPLAVALLLAAAPAMAQHDQGHDQQQHEQPGHEPQGQHGGPARPAPQAARPGEPHAGPKGYHRAQAPKGWNARPKTFDPKAYQHNYRAAHSYRVGPYHRPEGWADHRWVYGEVLPRAYWAAEYVIADYWLFALEVPPVGYEWVRDANDALLVNVTTGQILQVEYGVFA